MLVPNQTVEVKWSCTNKKWYENKGYIFTKFNDTFVVKVEDLTQSSKALVKFQCDYCGDIIEKKYGVYIRGLKYTNKCSCNKKECRTKKIIESKNIQFEQTRKNHIESFYKKCEMQGYKPLTIFDDYNKSGDKVRFECPKHGIMEVGYFHFMDYLYGCPKCGWDQRAENNKLTTDEVIKRVESKNNNKLMNPNEYIDEETSNLIIKCGSCQNNYVTSLSSIDAGNGRCPKCKCSVIGDKRRRSKEEAIQLVESKNNNKLLNPDDYVDSHTSNLIIKCGCGRIYTTSLINYLLKVDGKCTTCKPKSYGEQAISLFLESNSIKYTREERFDGTCRDLKPLPFDFYLPDFNLCIEFDGIHHYKPVRGEEAFKKTILHDGMKNNYCKWNNIDLLRIPYWEEKNVEKILTDYLGINSKNGFYKIKYIPRSKRMKNKKIKIA